MAGGVFINSVSAAYDPFIIVHPHPFTGSGGPLTVKICAQQMDPNLTMALEGAIKKWNDLVATAQNCRNCYVIEDGGEPPGGIFFAESTFLHELGHCAFGLDHINVDITSASYTNTRSWITFDAGVDTVRGSGDDVVTPLPGARIVHWFRLGDNDPIKIDNVVIDQSTYSRNINLLPVGHSWPANGNREVAELLGYQQAGAVMYTSVKAGQYYRGLSADEVNTVRLAQAGLDLVAGTGDDYSTQLVLQEDCGSADLKIISEPLGQLILGSCSSGITAVSGIHFRLLGAPRGSVC